MSKNLPAAQAKLAGNPDTEIPPPFPFDDLPDVREDPLWTVIMNTYGLSLPELSALKNARCGQPQAVNTDPSFTMYRLRFAVTKAILSKGVRSIAFHNAVAVGAVYNNDSGTHKTSFFYEEGNLQVNLLFYSRADASLFLSKLKSDLFTFNLSSTCKVPKYEILQVDIANHQELNMVDETEYEKAEMGSPWFQEMTYSVGSRSSAAGNIVKEKDGYVCRACGLSFAESKNRSQLQAAHILDVEEVETAKTLGPDSVHDLLRSVDLTSAAEGINLISLCAQCHNDYFDQYKICINYDNDTNKYFWEVKDSVVNDDMPQQKGRYGDLRGREIAYPAFHRPPPALIKHRMKQYLANNGKKRKRIDPKGSIAFMEFLRAKNATQSQIDSFEDLILKIRKFEQAKRPPTSSKWRLVPGLPNAEYELWFNDAAGELKFLMNR